MKRITLVIIGLLIATFVQAEVQPLDQLAEQTREQIQASECKQTEVPENLQRLIGENAEYRISFLFFKRIAEGRISLEQDECTGIYTGIMRAKAKGLTAFLSSDRLNRYESKMEFSTEDNHLRSLSHISEIRTKKGRKYRTYDYDYANNKIDKVYNKYGNVRKSQISLEDKLPVFDFLTVFFNLRAGLMEEFRTDNTYTVPGYTDGGFFTIKVEVVTKRRGKIKKFFPKGGTLWEIILDKETFGTDEGSIYTWFNEEGTMGRGIVENVIGLGDVKGILEEGKHKQERSETLVSN